ncbi:OLC1v1028970C2 [Oldenlandia corymbosa var. corymbosa]|uniref:OLC1v1028970C2 n=1 Tax=Oldenlandia corymbosa var. corymbosa TaxID=529605 RepID=A0AAV1CEB2_OLDCO|nr:OLC1v1028970C2 [Oldenlandia corymbosa var. corymbosa]
MIINHLSRFQSFPSTLTQFFSSKTRHQQFIIHCTLLSKSFSTNLLTKTPNKNPSTLPQPISSESPELSDVQISIDKLFLPPDTDVSSFTAPLSSRVLKGSNIVLSKYASDSQVVSAEFIKSSVKTEDCPSDGLPEFALVGRSNVGKSSLLNSLVRRKRLALTSKKPGKTQCINHFKINDSWYLVDLPGYGYAAAPQELRTDWDKFTKDYFLNRQTLVSVFLLIDASIPAKPIDLQYASWLGKNQVIALFNTLLNKKNWYGNDNEDELFAQL